MAAITFNRNFVAGAYSVTWGASGSEITLGYTEAGFEWMIDVGENVPVQEDRHGMAIVDGILQNIRSMYIRLESLYFNENSWQAALPQLPTLAVCTATGAVIDQTAGTMLVQGGLAKPLILTPKTGTAAVAGQPNNVITFALAYSIDPVALMFSARELRRVTMNFQIFPVLTSDDTKEATWFQQAVVS